MQYPPRASCIAVLCVVSCITVLILWSAAHARNAPEARRAELRELSRAERARWAAALWTLKRSRGEAGREQWGAAFVSYDELVARHWTDVVTLRCNASSGEAQSVHTGALFGECDQSCAG